MDRVLTIFIPHFFITSEKIKYSYSIYQVLSIYMNIYYLNTIYYSI